MEKIQVVVAHASSEMREQMGMLVLKLARNYKCKVALSHTRFPEGSPGLVGIYGTRSKQRTRLQEGVYSTFAQLSKGSILLATRPGDTQPMMLSKLKVVPRYVVHCGEVMPKHLKGTEVDPETMPVTTTVTAVDLESGMRYELGSAELPTIVVHKSSAVGKSEVLFAGGPEKYDEDYDGIDVFMSLFTKQNLPVFIGLVALIAALVFLLT